MAICSSQPDGFGPSSHTYAHMLTACFLNTILVPLCTWLYFLTLVILIVLSHSLSARRFSSHKAHGSSPGLETEIGLDTAESIRYLRPLRPAKTRMYKAFYVLYFLLIFAQLLMTILEMVRLGLAHLGIDLLPFQSVAIVVAGVLHLMRRFSKLNIIGWTWANVGLWLALIVVNIVRLVGQAKEGINDRKGTKYPVADEVTDIGVMIGVFVALMVLEIVLI